MTHEKEIVRFSKCQDGTYVWAKYNNYSWVLVKNPEWSKEGTYIVDDEYAEVRKFAVDNGFAWYNSKEMGWMKETNPMFIYPIEKYATSKPDEEVYYYKWKRKDGSNVYVCRYTTDNLSDDGWTRIDESKATYEQIKG
jgi:hypothetical protein